MEIVNFTNNVQRLKVWLMSYLKMILNNEVLELKGLERLGDNCEEFENKVALCKDCHGYYDDHKTKDEYLNLLTLPD